MSRIQFCSGGPITNLLLTFRKYAKELKWSKERIFKGHILFHIVGQGDKRKSDDT